MAEDKDNLYVWYEDQLVGHLWRNQQGYIGFRYDEGWLSNDSFPVSLTLPLTDEAYAEEANSIAQRFFANLLPEASVRTQIVRDLKIPDTDFDLLRAIGGECAGALSILSDDKVPLKEEQYEYTLLGEKELEQLINRRGQILFNENKEDKRPRFSLAGAQNKCPVLVKNGAYYLPASEEPTTNILKFEFPDYKHVPAYEAFTIKLAEKTGLPVINTKLCQVKEKYFTNAERYDRLIDKKITRLHQEDFCQALGYGYNRKYEEDGGPTFNACLKLVRDVSSDPVVDSENLLRWLIFNFLCGNSDGHAKNLSLLYTLHEGIRLAPFYDLVCTRAIESISTRLAFKIGGVADPGQVGKRHWVLLADECDVGKNYLLELLERMAEELLGKINDARKEFESEYGEYPALQRIEQVVQKQCVRTLKS